MKIIQITPYYPPHLGGVENYIYNISKGLKEKYNLEKIVKKVEKIYGELVKK